MISRDNDPSMVGSWISEHATRTPHKTAIEFLGDTITYDELERSSTALAISLLERGLVPGDRIATLTENRPEQVILFFACAKAGLVLAPLNWHLTPSELTVQLDLFIPELLVLSEAQSARFAASPLVSTRAPLRMETLLTDLPDSSSLMPLVPLTSNDPLLLIATSGTTGTPKGAVLTHANCYWTNRSLDLSIPITADDVVLQVLPQYHVGGWNVQPLLAWWKGATVVLEPSFVPKRVLELISTRHVNTMMGVPTTFLMLAQHPDFANADLSSLHSVVVGGATMPQGLTAQWLERGIAIAQGYGLTEAAPNVLCLSSEDITSHPGSVGKPYKYVDVALRDEAGEVVEGVGRGEIWVRGSNVFSGYWQNRAATTSVLRDGWLRTGDVAERDGDGYYSICGRTKEMFVSGGENVFPLEVECVLAAYEHVIDAALVGVDDPLWGEAGVAFVVAKQNEHIDVAQLLAHCRERLASFKIPRAIYVVDELPRTHIGKVDKVALSKLAVQGLKK